MPRNKKTDDLLRVLGQRVPSAPPVLAKNPLPPHEPRREERVASKIGSLSRPPAPKGRRGKAVQFWLHTEDEKLIRELAVWLAPHRKRINDSLVVKAVLRAAKTGPGFLAAYDDALSTDGRSKGRMKTRKQAGKSA